MQLSSTKPSQAALTQAMVTQLRVVNAANPTYGRGRPGILVERAARLDHVARPYCEVETRPEGRKHPQEVIDRYTGHHQHTCTT